LKKMQDAGVAPTQDDFKYVIKMSGGSSHSDISPTLVAIINEEGDLALSGPGISSKHFGLVFDKTIFYAESGGQMNDVGTITIARGSSDPIIFNVHDVQVYAGYVLHSGTIEDDLDIYADIIHVGDKCSTMKIDKVSHMIITQVGFIFIIKNYIG
jgi:alanyl-tRNA synthetase